MAFEGFDPIFSKPKVEWTSQRSSPLCPFFVHVYAADSSHLVIHVTNICDAWEARLSLSMLEDIRDIVGIGGSWSEFVNYFITSLKSQDLKLVLEANSNSDASVSHAKLVAQKSKGMPLITIPLTKVVDCTAMEVKLNFCSSLFDAFKMKSMECSLVKGVRNLSKKQEHSARTNMLAAEKERNESIQLEQRQKFQKISDLDNGVSTEGLQNSPDKQATRHGGSTKVKNRKVPAYRRTKVRGALLHDNEE
ncbi:uncharacterized protein LOC108344991 isoform X2 [Vigna angularis]|uniref:uncharacterized protein LOC108344991 isoform X2 n=1 Tax=Phaseolus angularis TaxID=3914 RepID=UPI0022B357A3|nr:uncharacterized protein LOC108344991 isoform X2 [Vigna angularis]